MKVVVVGNGMVGHHFVEQLRKQSPTAEILVLGAEPRLAYDRVHLSEYFEGKTAEELALTNAEQYQRQDIQFLTDAKVVDIKRDKKCVVLANGDEHGYDKLVLATGSYPFVPPIPGNDQPHCLVYRTIEDLEAIQASAACSKVGVVIGGGLLGLEPANALKEAGLKTHVVEFAPQLMAVQLDAGGGKLLKKQIEALDVEVHTDKATNSIEAGSACRYVMLFADGTSLETDMILFSAGIRPQDELAKTAGLTLGPRGGIEVDDRCKTSDEHIYAIGECALWQQRIFGLVAPGYQMARVAAGQLSDGDLTFTGADMSTKLKLLGIEVGSIGDAHGKTPGSMSYIFEDQPQQVYKKIVVDAQKKKLLGAVLVGDTQDYDTLLQYALNDMELPEAPESLILPMTGDIALPAAVLPDSAIICSCHNVSKGDVIGAIDSGATDLAAVKSCTKASTGCGGCAALLKTTFDAELSSRGVEVNTDICEHFSFSRQELADIIRIESIRTFDELLEKHGRGLGCDICKPAVGSILASTWNDYVLSPDHVSLQDTNDTFLANMQKDGTYSVVPRVPGGEITPDKLITLGTVAKDHGRATRRSVWCPR
jgi:nitrite reductase (NADH) large subunit